jgi:O-antigen/teichoic acid export membrane protein
LKNVPDKLTGSSVARGSILLTISQYLGIAIRMATVVILTRELGVRDYGLYVIAFSVYLAVSSGFFFGARRAVVADISREIGSKEFGRVRRLLVEFSALQLFLGAVLGGGVALVTLVFGDDLLHGGASEWMGLVAILVAITALKHIAWTGLVSHGSFSTIAAQRLLETAARLVAILVLVVVLDRGVGGVLEADIIAHAIGLALSFPVLVRSSAYLRSYESHRGWILPGILKAHGKWDALTSIGTQLTASATNWVVAGILDAEAVGVYSLAKRSVGFVKVGLPLKTVLTPLMARRVGDPVQLRRIFNKALQYSVQFNVLMSVIGGALAYPVFRFVFPEFFPLVLPIFLLLLLRYILSAFNTVTNPLVEAMQAQRISFITLAVRRLLYFAVSPALMLGFGVIGAAVEAVIATIILSLVKYRLVARLGLDLRIDVSSLFRFDVEDRNFVKGALLGKLKKVSLNRP